MKRPVYINPELARLAIKSNLVNEFAIWSILRDFVAQSNSSSHFKKAAARKIVSDYGLSFTIRHWTRIWANGDGIFWGMDEKRFVFLRSMKRVFRELGKAADDRVQSRKAATLRILVDLTGTTQERAAKLYHAWFLARGEVTMSRDTIQDLFGLSHDQQRAYEKLLGDFFLIKTNYAHIDAARFRENPQELPEFHFEFEYERLTTQNKLERVNAIQYQLPNTFIARPLDSGVSPVRSGARSAKKACRTLSRHYPSFGTDKRLYYLFSGDFEANGTTESYCRIYFQGKKRLWAYGQYF